LVAQLNTLWKYFARVEGGRWIALALDLANEETPPSVVADLTLAEATVAWQLREYTSQLASSDKAIAFYRSASDAFGVARAQDVASAALWALGRLEESAILSNEVLAFARQTGSPMMEAGAMRQNALTNAFLGNHTSARGGIARALQLYGALGAKLDAAATLTDLAEVEFCAGNTELALHHARDALARFGECDGFDVFTMDVQSDMTRYLIELARYDEAEACARETLDSARSRQEEVYAAFALRHLGVIGALRPKATRKRASDVCSQAAQILGFSDVRLAAMGSRHYPGGQPLYHRAIAALRQALGADVLAHAMAAGAAMTEEQAMAQTLSGIMPARH
jgi:tetratricopeptide (TPR) repeat protein